MQHCSIKLHSLSMTQQLSCDIADILLQQHQSVVVGLIGGLGAGKTTMIRYLLHHLGITGAVKSPTFTIVEPYAVNDITVYHFDLFRLNSDEDWYMSGFDEYLSCSTTTFVFIEWINKIDSLLHGADLKVELLIDNDVHKCDIYGLSKLGNHVVSSLNNQLYVI